MWLDRLLVVRRYEAWVDASQTCDLYRVTHRRDGAIEVYAENLYEARWFARVEKGWDLKDMHARIVEVNGRRKVRTHRLRGWLASALPFNLWR